jgi:nickel superoxide dismutase
MDRSATAIRHSGQRIEPSLIAVTSTGYCRNPVSMIRHERRRSMRLLARLLEPRATAHAHCDLPCGVYDPAQARIEAESVRAICEKYQQNDDPAFRTRALQIKEERSELVKHHLWVLWTDYFKPPHFEKYPQLNQLFNEATKLAGGGGGTKSSTEVATADKLLAKIDDIGKIFWETKQG